MNAYAFGISAANMVPTYDECIGNDARYWDATKKFENDVNIDIGGESTTHTKHKQHKEWKQDHEAPAKPGGKERAQHWSPWNAHLN